LGEEPQGREALQAALSAGLRTAEASQAADLLYLLGKLAAPEEAATWYAAAAAAQRAGFTGDAARDRGYWTWYAQLLHLAGATDDALAFLERAREQFPGEPTWALAGCGLLLDEARYAEVITWADRDRS